MLKQKKKQTTNNQPIEAPVFRNAVYANKSSWKQDGEGQKRHSHKTPAWDPCDASVDQL